MRCVATLFLLTVIGYAIAQPQQSLSSSVNQSESNQNDKGDRNAKPTLGNGKAFAQTSLPVIEITNIAQEQIPSADTRDKSREEKNELWNTGFFHVTITDVLISIFTGLLCIAAYYQLRELRSTVSAMREDFVSTHRPKLVIRRISIAFRQENGADTFAIFYVVANTGSTTATIIATSAKLWLPEVTDNLPAIPPYETGNAVDLPIGVGKEIQCIHHGTPKEFEEFCFREGYAKAKSSNSLDVTPELLFLGRIEYIDKLGNQRQTAFLRRYNYVTGRFSPINEPDYEYQD